jgi:hypothetical protein
MAKEVPFYSPHERAKLFQRFTFDKEIEVGDTKEVLDAQFSNFVNHKRIKWLLEKRLENGRYVPFANAAIDDENVYIKSNTLEDISQGDVIWLKCPIFPKGVYLIVAGTVEQDFGYYPKMRKVFVHVPLKTIYNNSNC